MDANRVNKLLVVPPKKNLEITDRNYDSPDLKHASASSAIVALVNCSTSPGILSRLGS